MAAQKIDDQIRALFNKLDERKARVAELNSQVAKGWKTTCTIRINGAATPTNITTASVDVIETIASFVIMTQEYREAASSRLDYKFDDKIQGYVADDWLTDLKKRLATINIREEEKQLATLEARLNQVLSPEERRRIEVELLLKEV